MSHYPIDLDAEAVQYDGQWFTREELAQRIKKMLDAGDFAVGKPSQALEELTGVLAQVRTLAFRLSPEMADQLNEAASRHGRTLGSLIREALVVHLNLNAGGVVEGAAGGGATGASPSGEPPTPPGGFPGPQAAGSMATGPGGLRGIVADVPGEAAPVALTAKKKTDEEERGWFGR